MKANGIKFYVYFIILACVALFIQGAYITIHQSDDYVFTHEQSTEIIITATEMREKTENPQITQIGNVGWAIIGLTFASGAVAAFVLHPIRFSMRKAHRSRGAKTYQHNYHSRSYAPVYSSASRSSRQKTSLRKVNRPFYTMRTTVQGNPGGSSGRAFNTKVTKQYW